MSVSEPENVDWLDGPWQVTPRGVLALIDRVRAAERERDHASDVVAAIREELDKARVRAEAAEARIAELEAEQ